MQEVYTVSELVTAVSAYLEQGLGTIVVQGEVTGYRVAKDRLVYFELKDASARVLCFAIVGDVVQPIEDGMEIRVAGIPKLFKTTGGFHLRVVGVELVGEGALQRAFMLTKQKLEREGLFSDEFKKPLPRFPETVGIITSKDAAAFTDVVRILNNRWGGMRIVLAPVGVQGPSAVPEIVSAIQWFNTNAEVHPDVMIVTRGGGSLEDLQAFNSEEVCRTIFSSRIPIVCGVGHERDTTLAELVADVRASTPSNAAERVAPDRRDVSREVEQMAARVEDVLTSTVATRKHQVDLAVAVMRQLFESRLQRMRTVLSNFVHASNVFEKTVSAMRERVASFTRLIKNLGPEATLKRGYTITFLKGEPVRSARVVTRGDKLTTRFTDGAVISEVT